MALDTRKFAAATYHYPPELLTLLVDALSKLCRAKRDVVLFFRGAGVPGHLLGPWEVRLAQDRHSVRKHEIARDLLRKLNERQDNEALRLRREVVKRVVEIEDFSMCWPEDQGEARGLVASIRDIVSHKDTVTRINQELERERAVRRQQYEAQAVATRAKKDEREAIRRDLFALFGQNDPLGRGKALEHVLNRLFKSFGIHVREAFRRVERDEGVVEQIDGVVGMDGHLYLVEMKWHTDRLGVEHIAPHLVRVYGRGDVRGIVISSSGFTRPACIQVKEALSQKVFFLCELREIIFLLEREGDLGEFLRCKCQAAELDKEPLFEPL